jgi:hypothetical protein
MNETHIYKAILLFMPSLCDARLITLQTPLQPSDRCNISHGPREQSLVYCIYAKHPHVSDCNPGMYTSNTACTTPGAYIFTFSTCSTLAFVCPSKSRSSTNR